jgi:hypothetical protein
MMANCVVCNRKIPKGEFFCRNCLKEESRRKARPSRLGLRFLASLFPFSAIDTGELEINARDLMESLVKLIRQQYSDISLEQAQALAEEYCARQENQTQELSERYQEIRRNKPGGLRAPHDLILQPVSVFFLLSFLIVVTLVFVL